MWYPEPVAPDLEPGPMFGHGFELDDPEEPDEPDEGAVDGVEPVLGVLVAGELVLLLGGAVVLELLLEVLLGGVVVVVVAAYAATAPPAASAPTTVRPASACENLNAMRFTPFRVVMDPEHGLSTLDGPWTSRRLLHRARKRRSGGEISSTAGAGAVDGQMPGAGREPDLAVELVDDGRQERG